MKQDCCPLDSVWSEHEAGLVPFGPCVIWAWSRIGTLWTLCDLNMKQDCCPLGSVWSEHEARLLPP